MTQLGAIKWKHARKHSSEELPEGIDYKEPATIGEMNMIWQLISREEPRYWIASEDNTAFAVGHGVFYHRRNKKDPKHGYSLYMISVGIIDNYSSMKKLEIRLKEIIESANYPVIVMKYEREKSKLFAQCDSTSKLWANAKPDCYLRAFNIKEFGVKE